MLVRRSIDIFYIVFAIWTLFYLYSVDDDIITFAFCILFFVFLESRIIKDFKEHRELAAEDIHGRAKFDEIMDRLGLDLRKRKFPDYYSFILLLVSGLLFHQVHDASTGNIFRDVMHCEAGLTATSKICGFVPWHFVAIKSILGFVGFLSCWHIASYLVFRFKALRR